MATLIKVLQFYLEYFLFLTLSFHFLCLVLILNFETNEVETELTRLKGLGAVVIKAPYSMGEAKIATLADPDGNYLQLMTPWEEQKD